MDEGTAVSWGPDGLVPAIVQDARTGQVLMLAYMNKEALARTLETGETHFWSRSRNGLWHKGATSGNTQQVEEIRVDCDGDALLVRVKPAGPACHTGKVSCFYRDLASAEAASRPPDSRVIHRLEGVIAERKAHPREGSYTSQLFAKGEKEIAKKVGEEGVEVAVATLAEGDDRVLYEMADLVYHGLVLLAQRGLRWADLEGELARRFK
ncbi:MAG: bifunctional phosphoribosyl-AMP cyclohydrolase/phosphoribosyl-ATP diphosphatase HisIE [Anaerolineae bacterium]|nr:bifunctional phosphoribosyl-AMP cyclohydrolase/phosphoribosyl-ATP diphosphatase HisIE [Anaerolineae bacterium]